MPICLADQHRIEIEGVLKTEDGSPVDIDYHELGELHKGDEIKVVISNIRGDGDILVRLTNYKIPGQRLLGRVVECTPFCRGCCGLLDSTISLIEAIVTRGESGMAGKIFVNEGEEKVFTIPKDGVWYLEMDAIDGSVAHYKGYIEVIKTEK